MKPLLILLALSLSGCATYEGRNRILVCFGFCALQGVQVIRDGEHDMAILIPEVAPPKPEKK